MFHVSLNIGWPRLNPIFILIEKITTEYVG